MAAISAFRVTQHSQIFHFSLEIEFNALHFISYTIPRLSSSYAVATIKTVYFRLAAASLSFIQSHRNLVEILNTPSASDLIGWI